ncbi:hypothetical protein [Paenibacillus contaminans]|uniref:Uncharacterized protein n=1 Tax=Paenibacillus contaminans TaxID=450362 RepID=A0A329MSU7_9BACL|nr:hypothetical protein [Paenibacillus contaminans]RAV22874.1 hypothetical protein DQG23_01305 [Paenibacillus contaminans]
MAKVSLERIRFAGFHKSHVGAIKSCADYLNIPCSAAWVYGITGSAFMSVMDEDCAAPNIGEPEERMFEAACHIGLDIRGLHAFAEAADFERLQREAWDAARNAIDRGLPVFAKELDLGNETSIIHAYNDEGYFTHSWHGGSGHEGFDEVIPWQMLGRNYCPCAQCRARSRTGERANDSVYTGDPDRGGFISLHWATPCTPTDDLTALRAGIGLALDISQLSKYEWGGRTLYSGLLAYDRWIESVRTNNILGFYMGYYADNFHESRHNAFLFLREACERFDGELGKKLSAAADHYKLVKEQFQALSLLFPWSQPHEPIEDPDRRKEAVDRLIQIRELEKEGYRRLEKLLSI